MIAGNKPWRQLFWFCFGLFAGTAFCMKWMEGDLWQGGEKFTIIGLEASYSKEKLARILSGLDEPVKRILRYHLSFDFAFMAGVYPGIAALCMMARAKIKMPGMRKFLLALAFGQTIAWGCDIIENGFLFQWIKEPLVTHHDFKMYHLAVYIKWAIALIGALLGILFHFRGKETIRH